MTCVFFVRRYEVLRLEVHVNENTREFAIVVEEGHGRAHRDDFADVTELRRGLAEVEDRLKNEHWLRAGPPIVIPGGVSSRR